MTKPKKKRINKNCMREPKISSKTRKLVECKCILHCHGSKMVDPRTLKKHRKEMELLRVITSESHGTSRSSNTNRESPNLIRGRTISPVDQNRSPSNDSSDDDDDDEDDEIQSDQEPVDPIDLPKKRKRRNKFRRAVPGPDEQE